MATHSSVLAWRIPGMGEPGWLPSMRSHRVGHDCSNLAAAAAARPAPSNRNIIQATREFLNALIAMLRKGKQVKLCLTVYFI